MKTMRFNEVLYNTLTMPKSALHGRIGFRHSVLLYALGCAGLVIAIVYFMEARLGIFGLFMLTFSVFAYIAISGLIKISLIHTVASISIGYRTDKNIKTFISDCLRVHIVFIFLSPIALLMGGLPRSIGIAIFSLLTVLCSFYYIYLLFSVVKNTFSEDSGFKVLILMAMPIMYDYVNVCISVFFFTSVLANFATTYIRF